MDEKKAPTEVSARNNFWKLLNRENIKSGGPLPTVDKIFQPHDNISICRLTKRGITEKIVDLYESGESLLAISEQLRVSRWKARTLLQEKKIQLRSQEVDEKKPRKKPVDRTKKVAPYGYCLVNGKLMVDPKEQSVIQRIDSYCREGLSHRAIARKLNRQKFKPRRADTWSQTLVSSILKRQLISQGK